MFHDGAEDGGLHVIPLRVFRLGDGDEIGAEEDAGDVLDREDASGEGRFLGRLRGWEIRCPHLEYGLARKELEGRGVRCGFGLNEHGLVASICPQHMRAGPAQVKNWNDSKKIPPTLR